MPFLLWQAVIADTVALEKLCAEELVKPNEPPSAALLALAVDESRPSWIRARAIRLLGFFATATSEIEALAHSTDAVVRRATAHAFVTLYRGAPALMLAALTPLLDDVDPSVRRTAALSVHASPCAREALVERVARESDPSVRAAIKISLDELRSSSESPRV